MKHVLEIDQDDIKYLQYLDEPVFTNNELNESVKKENILSRLNEIILFNSTRPRIIKEYQKLRPVYCYIKLQLRRVKNRFQVISNYKNVNN